MEIKKTCLRDCYIIKPDIFGDERGYFSPFFIKEKINKIAPYEIFKDVVQANRSLSSKGTVRGLHYQKNPKCQAKIVEVLNGSAVDVVVDMRKDSETFGKHTSVLLSSLNKRQLLVPRGFAHGFVSLEDNTLFQYLVDNEYAKELEGGIFWNDPKLGIDWEEIFSSFGIEEPLLSPKDQFHGTLEEKIQNNEIDFKCPVKKLTMEQRKY